MILEEFAERTRYNPDEEEFAKIQVHYGRSDLHKDDFCRRWKAWNAPYPIKLECRVFELEWDYCVYVEDSDDIDGIFVKGFATEKDAFRAVELIQAGHRFSDSQREFKSYDSHAAAIRLYEKIWGLNEGGRFYE